MSSTVAVSLYLPMSEQHRFGSLGDVWKLPLIREPFLTQRNNADMSKHHNWPSRHGRTTDNTISVAYLLPGGMTGGDRLSYPLRLIGTAHAWLCTSLCRFSDIDEQSKGLCYCCNMNIQRQCSGDFGTEVVQNFFNVCKTLQWRCVVKP